MGNGYSARLSTRLDPGLNTRSSDLNRFLEQGLIILQNREFGSFLYGYLALADGIRPLNAYEL